MKIQILGSAAAEGWPALFCECDACKNAWKTRGKDIRRRTAYLIDDSILVDFGPDVFWQSVEFGIDLSDVQAVFFTHSHADHCDPVELEWRRGGFSVVKKTLDLFGNEATMNKIAKPNAQNPDWERYHGRPHTILPGQTVSFNGYEVTGILASHAAAPELPLNYVFRAPDGTTALIANDTGWWRDESWELARKFRFDIAIIEATMGLQIGNRYGGHLSVDGTVRFRDRLAELGALTGDTFVAANHFSHNGGGSHRALEDYFNPNGIAVCYDGMVIER